MTASIAVRPDTKRRLEEVRIQLINQLRTSRVTWDKTINALIEVWSQGKTSTRSQRRMGLKTLKHSEAILRGLQRFQREESKGNRSKKAVSDST